MFWKPGYKYAVTYFGSHTLSNLSAASTNSSLTFSQANAGMVPSHGFNPRSYFFDNPRRYDSDDDLAWNIAPQGAQGR